MTKTTAIIILKEYQDWRRGRNEYDWRNCSSPEKIKKFPFNAIQLGIAIDKGIMALEKSLKLE